MRLFSIMTVALPIALMGCVGELDSDSGGLENQPPDMETPSGEAPDDPPEPPTPAPCLDGNDQRIDVATGTCYFVYYESTVFATYADAVTGCATVGAKLADISSAAEQAIVGELVVSAALSGPERESYWIAANDMEIEGTFMWEDGTPMEYSNWNVDEPNDANGEDCTEILGQLDGLWNDQQCQNPRGYVCERAPL